ncbi:uncharacterized protein LOC110991164 [Acanthaster planci]|uniref:Uncharacterized protein LOC110991164 n=1 Tax=Acanthaster planci TaxID=133434 RepID=A0A8B8A3W5_ACAPL|nr:uncharacterized protein LOC110991164 [Acanthaster planci]
MGQLLLPCFCFLLVLCIGTPSITACFAPLDLSGPLGNVSTPDYPDPYPQEYDCQLINITVSQGQIISLKFDGFDLGDDDVLMITEPSKPDPLILRGGRLPKNYYSHENTLQLNFTSESYNVDNRTGFLVYYTESDRVLPTPKTRVVPYTLSPGRPTVIRSLDYPQSYGDFAFYFYTFTSAPNTRIWAEIMDLDTEEGFDFLEMGNGVDPEQRFATRMRRVSGRGSRFQSMLSENNEMWMLFESDYSVVGRGFSVMLYETSLDFPDVKNLTAVPDNVTCGDSVNIPESGSISVQLTNYANNSLCTWRVSGVAGLRIRMSPNLFSLENGFDVLEVGNGLDPMDQSSRFVSLTGNGPSGPVMLESDAVWLRFRSDASVSDQGFQINFDQPITTECGGEFYINETHPSFIVAVDGMVLPMMQCRWIIRGRPGHFISGNVTRFKMEDIYDMVEIGTGDNPADPKTRVKMMSGNVDGGKFYTIADTVWVVFTLNGTQAGEGFSITFADDACGISTLLDRQGTIQSPGYPLGYPNNADCQWIIQVRGGYRINLTVNDLRTEYGFDKLLIGGVEPQDSGWSPCYELTGDMMKGVSVLSDYNGLSLRFVSDGSKQDMGFSVSYEETFFCPEGYELGNNDSACYKFVLAPASWEEARDECLGVDDGDLLVINDEAEFEYIKEMSFNISGDWWVGWYDRAIEGQWSWVDCQASTDWANSKWSNRSFEDAGMEEDCGMLLGDSGLLDDKNCSLPVKFVCETTKKDYAYTDAFPSLIRGQSTSEFSILLSWRVSSLVCDLRGYQIRYNTTASMDQFTYIDVDDPMANSVEVTGLMPDTKYLFEFVIDTFSYGLSSYRTAKSVFASTAKCPNEFEPGPADICYKFVKKLVTYEEARDDCQRTPGGDLVIIDNPTEQQYIQNRSVDGDWWIGLNDRAVEGRFRWTDCSPLTIWQSTQWAPDQPNNLTDSQDCGQFLETGQWNDWPCDRPMQYICEIITKNFDPENVSPGQFSATEVDPFSIQLSWVPPLYNCDIKGYAVMWGRVGDPLMMLQIEGVETSEYLVGNLLPEETYSFQIAAETFRQVLRFSSPQNVTLSDSTGYCPGGYEVGPMNNTCYKFVKKLVTWDEARMDCGSVRDGDLVIIDDVMEHDYIMERVVDGDWWIGFSDRGVEGRWQSVNCLDLSPWQTSKWAPDQPNDLSGTQDCGQLLETGQWNDWQCDRPMQYICEITPKAFNPEEQVATNLTVVDFTSTTVTLGWLPPPYTCDVLGYRITYSTSLSIYTLDVEGGDTSKVVVGSLRPLSLYSFNIQTKMAMGSSEPSDPITTNTAAYEGCQDVISSTDAVGNITSPLFPDDYPRLVNCLYRVDLSSSVGADSRIRLQFVYFSLGADDYVEIRELDSSARNYGTPVVIKGRGPIKDYFSSGSSLDIQFVSDASAEARGFRILYSQSEAAQPAEKDCGMTYTVKTNSLLSFQSVGYPNRHDNYQSCTWVFTCQPDKVLFAYLLQAGLEDGYDWVAVGNGNDPTNETALLERFTGQATGLILFSEDNMMWITLYSDYSISGMGFSFLLEEIDPSEVPVPPPKTQRSHDFGIQATCGGDVLVPTDGKAIITSPNYPGEYDINTTCTWLITGIPGRRFQMIFDFFETEKNYDLLSVGAGLDPLDPTSLRTAVSGSSLPSNIVLASDTAWVEFTSDSSTIGNGFSISLQNGNDCELILTVPSGGNMTVESPNYPNVYPNNSYCFWTIVSQSGRPLRGDVIRFSTEDGYDFVDVGVGNQPADLSTRFIHTSGSGLQPFSANSSTLWMTFTSDGTNNAEGFQVVFLDDGCDDSIIENTTSGRIESLNFPNTYPNNLDCTWTIRVGEIFRVKLVFEAFNVESGYDKLIIDGVDGDGSLTLTGSNLPDDVLSATNVITIQFQTDSDGGASGFALTFEEIYYCPGGYVAFQVGEGYTCYKFSADEKNWIEARKDCQSTDNGDLIIIENALENRGIAEITGGLDWWLGFYDRANEGVWRWVDCQAPTSWGNLNWEDPSGPDSTNGDEDCAIILDSSGRYQAIPCETPRRYICEIGEPKIFDGNPVSVSGFSFTSSSIHLEWTLSPQRCDVLSYFVQYSTLSGSPVETIVTGSNTNELDVFDLVRGTSYFFSIAAVTFTSGKLAYTDPVEIQTLQFDSEFCPPGYQGGWNYQCYKFVLSPVTWDEARADCRSVENGDLIDINFYAELLYINETAPGETLWIGYYDKGIEGDWRWSDCELPNAWQAINWAPDAPNDPLGNQDCAELTPDLLWDDQPCNGNVINGYVCEIYTKGYNDTDQNPTEITGEALTATRVSLTWTISIRFVCDVLGYKIEYSFDDQEPKIQRVDGASTGRAVVEGLVPNKNYTFLISAYSSLGDVTPTASVSVVTPDGDLCPQGYQEGYDYGCYKFVTSVKPWNESRRDCQSTEDGDLLIIDSQAELDFITQAKENISGTWWIGFSDSAEEGQWRWVDCSAPSGLNGTYWADGQPSDTTGTENCAELTQDSKFNDLACTSQLMYVCEITRKEFFPSEVDPTNFLGVSTTSESVLLRWTVSDYNCDIQGYKIQYRMNQGPEQQEIVPGSNTNNVNITGLMATTEYAFKLLAYTEFGDRGVAGITNVTTQEDPNACPEDGWEVGHGGKCYKFVRQLETWYDARAVCKQDADGDLVIIETQEENLYIQDRVQDGDWWIVSVEGDWRWVDCSTPSPWTLSNWGEGQPNNLNGNQHCGQILNDGKYNDWQCDRTMQFICEISPKPFDPSDGNPSRLRVFEDTPNSVLVQWRPSLVSCDVIGYRIAYNDPIVTNFKEVQGGNISSVVVTGLQDGSTYFFSIAGFTQEQLLPYSDRVSIVTPPLDDLCEDGWEPGLDYKCYKFGLLQKTWEEARADCQKVTDGDLVIVETQEEHSYLVNRTLGGDWWIGFYDQGTEGDWRWVDCQVQGTWPSTNWGNNQPNDLDGSQDCGQMLQTGLWNDWNCERPMQYICEINPKGFSSEDQGPTLFRGVAIDPTTIQLAWRPSQYNCEVLGYRIVYEEENVGKTLIVEGGATSSVLLKSLSPGAVYVFFIGAFTKDEELDLEGRSVRIQLPQGGVCGKRDLTASSGTIASPNYPSAYPANQDCIFTVSLPDSGASILIEFTAFDLEKGHDFLMMGPGLSPDMDTQYSLTGSELPQMAMIESSRAWIRFFSDESNQRLGFSLMYSTAKADSSGENIGSITLVLISQSFESFNEAIQTEFATAVVNQLNIYCKLDETNCLVDSTAEFTYREIRFTSLQDVDEGLQVTFWVTDPNDPMRRQAGLTSYQLQVVLDEYKANVENGGQFQFVVRTESNPLSEPWVIALLCVLGLLVLLLLVVIARDLTSRRKKKPRSLSSSDVEMKSREDFMTTDDAELIANADEVSLSSEQRRIPSAVNDNVYYVNPNAASHETEVGLGSLGASSNKGILKEEVSDPKTEVTGADDQKEGINGNIEVQVEPEPLYAATTKQSLED